MQSFKKFFSIFLRIGISLILLVLLFKFNKIDTHGLWETIKSANKLFLFLSFFVLFLNYCLCLLRWRMLLDAADIHLPLKRVIISFSGGIFFNLFLPSTIGGDVMRSADLAAHTKKTSEVIATVFVDRLSGYTGLVILTLLSVLFGWKYLQHASVFFSVIIITAILAAVLLALFNKFVYVKINKFLSAPGAGKIKEAIKNLHHEIHIFRRQKKMIFYNLLLSLLVQATGPLSFYLIALALGLNIKAIYFFVFLPIIGAITLLPISIGGLGLRDASMIFYFGKVGVTEHMSLVMSLLSFGFIIIFGAIGGIIYVLTIRNRRLQHYK
jgi:glycosyltransferase 2 family protein